MTPEELFHSIVRGHKIVIVLCLLLPMIVVGVLIGTQPRQWDASVRMQVGAEVPTSATQAEGLNSRVLAVATTPGLLAKAMQDAGVGGSVREQAKKVSAQRLGESPVVRLSVTGSDAQRTGRLAGALARRVETFMNHGGRDAFDSVVAGLDASIADQHKAHAKLLDQLSKAVAPNARDNLQTALRQTEAELAQLGTERASLSVSDASREQTTLIEGDRPDIAAVPSSMAAKLALAGIFGLVLGLGMAAVLELTRPRLRGARAVARAMRAPVLGSADRPVADLAATLALAARRSGVETVVLVAADDSSRQPVSRLLAAIGELAPASTSRVGSLQPVPADSRTGWPSYDDAPLADPLFAAVRIIGMGAQRVEDELSSGIVVLTTGTLLRKDLDRLEDLVSVVRWPVLGVIDGSRLHHARNIGPDAGGAP